MQRFPRSRQSGLRSRVTRVGAAAALAVALTACGGSGGGADKPPSTNPGAAALLKISEVSAAYYSDGIHWVEVFNPGDQAVNLGDYVLRSGHINSLTTAGSSAPMAFNLPSVEIPAKGYLLIASKPFFNLKDNAQVVYVNQGGLVPYWGSDQAGFVEIVKDGATADFVRFGDSDVEPLTSAAWTGENAPAMPYGPLEYGKSLVRLASRNMPDTNRGADWVMVSFATPGGPNDVLPGARDDDGDGIPDASELNGGTYAGMNLHAMGARVGQRDLFFQLDYMAGADPADKPSLAALNKVVQAFGDPALPSSQRIAMHIDVGSLHNGTFDPARFNLGGAREIAKTKCLELGDPEVDTTPGCTSLFAQKNATFDVRRWFIFHYGIMGGSQRTDGDCGSAGQANLFGPNMIVTLGGCNLSNASQGMSNILNNYQAVTIMHEMGHNLGLRHGGGDNINYKPNYHSVMNYFYQLPGLAQDPAGPSAADRYYWNYDMRGIGICDMANSVCSEDFLIGYSHGKGADLDESALLEVQNIGYGATNGAYVDWNNDGVMNPDAYAMNIRGPEAGSTLAVLDDHDDWSNLRLPFQRLIGGSHFGPSLEPREMDWRHLNFSYANAHRLPVVAEHELLRVKLAPALERSGARKR